MKAASFAFLFVLPITLLAGEVNRGDSIETVRSALGAPKGELHLNGRDLLYYDQGEVELSSGLVTRAGLRSEKDQVTFEARRSAQADRARQHREILIAEGDALKARMLADPAFQAAPLSYQVAFWRNFSRKYSMVSCSEQLGIAQARLAEQTQASQQAEDAQRIAEIEAQEKAARRDDLDRIFYPISIYQPAGYSGGYFAYERRQRRLDRQYNERVRAGSSFGQSDVFHRDSGARRDGTRRNDRFQCFSGTSQGSASIGFVDQNQASSHTAEAFAGKNWMGWPSPTDPARLGSF